MKIRFWGTRGSLPSPIYSEAVTDKVKAAIAAAVDQGVRPDEVESFVERNLPFHLTGTYGGNTSCVELITDEDEYVICDMGSGLREFGNSVIAEHGPGKGNVFHIFQSHFHWDHIMGFPFFTPAYIPGNRITLFGCHENMERTIAAQHHAPYFPVEYEMLGAELDYVNLTPDARQEVGNFTVLPTLQHHPGDSYGFRFERDGKTVVYATDSEHNLMEDESRKRFLEFFRDADLVIFDAQYSLADAATTRENWGHSSNIIGVELVKEAGAKRLCLFHHDPMAGDAVLSDLAEKTERYADLFDPDKSMEVLIAYDGLVVDV